MARREPQLLKSLLPQLLKQVTRGQGSARALTPLWEQAAGPLIARHATPHAWEEKLLVLHVPHARWVKELTAKEPELRARMAEALGMPDLGGLVFRTRTA